MRMRKLFVGLLVLGLAVGMLGMVAFAKKGDDDDPSDTVTDAVTWMVRGFIELAIDDSSYDFVTIDAGVDTVSDDEANTLFVRSNADWELSSSIPWVDRVASISRSPWGLRRDRVTQRSTLATLCSTFARWSRVTTA